MCLKKNTKKQMFGSPITIHVWSFEASIKSIGTLRSALAYNLLGMDEGFNSLL